MTLPYRRAGHGPTLILVHGYLGGSEQWNSEIEHFARAFDVIAPDLPGFGDASDRGGCASISAMGDAIIGLLDELGVRDFALLGHSMGGMIAQDIAAKIGDRITHLVLYGTGPLGLMPDRFEPIELSKDRLRSDGVARTARRIAATWFLDGEDHPPGLDLLARIGARASPQAALAALDAMAGWDGRDALSGFRPPAIVIWGDSDRSYRWPQIEALWKSLSDVRLSVIPGAAHAAHLEKPAIFHAVLDDFFGLGPG